MVNIMTVYAHAADTACEAAGTLAIHAERGDRITVVVLTDGERHHNDLIYKEGKKVERDPAVWDVSLSDIVEFRRREVRRVGEILGYHKLIFLGWGDRRVEVNTEKVQELADVIVREKPDVMLAHLPVSQVSYMDEHMTAGEITRRAVLEAAEKVYQIDSVEPHRVKQVYYFPMDHITDSNNLLCNGIVCDVWVDITSVIEKKVRAIDQIVSQGYQGVCARKIVEARDGRWGMLAGTSYAEPFLRSKGVTCKALPIPENLGDLEYTPNDLPGDKLLGSKVPVSIPESAYKIKL